MKKVKIIVAHDQNGVIGQSGSTVLPWDIPEDFAHFKQTTFGHYVVMGKKTWESIPKQYRPLPNRTNIILTRKPKVFTDPLDVWEYSNLKAAIQDCYNIEPHKDVFIIGGLQIYRLALELDLVDEVIATVIRDDFEGDLIFPRLPVGDWVNVKSEIHVGTDRLSEKEVRFEILTYLRTR